MNRFILTLILLIPTGNSVAGGFPVYSAVEHTQSITEYIAILEDALVQLEIQGLNTQQLATQINTLQTNIQQYESHLRNISRLNNVAAYVEDGDIRAAYRETMSILDKVMTLDPGNPSFSELQRTILNGQFSDPDYRSSDQFEGAKDQNAVFANWHDSEEAYAEHYNKYRRYQEGQAMLEQHQNERKDYIGYMAEDINDLGDESQMDSMIITNRQNNLMLEQQEEIIDRLESMDRRAELEAMERAAAEQRAHEAQIQAIQRKASRKPYGAHLD